MSIFSAPIPTELQNRRLGLPAVAEGEGGSVANKGDIS